jgi:hypothetical protein
VDTYQVTIKYNINHRRRITMSKNIMQEIMNGGSYANVTRFDKDGGF